MRTFTILACFTMLLGCGPAPGTNVVEKPAVAKKEASPLPPAPKPVEVTANEFPSVDAAVKALDEATKLPDGQEQTRAITRCKLWLAMNKEGAAKALGATIADESAGLGLRLTGCLFLPEYGAAAKAPLEATAVNAKNAQVRRKSIESLGRLKPADPGTIKLLIKLLEDKNVQIVQQAINSLALIGEPAKEAAEKLGDLRMNSNEEAIRVAAGEALKKVSPRKTFGDK